jgi:hypothetical protein
MAMLNGRRPALRRHRVPSPDSRQAFGAASALSGCTPSAACWQGADVHSSTSVQVKLPSHSPVARHW